MPSLRQGSREPMEIPTHSAEVGSIPGFRVKGSWFREFGVQGLSLEPKASHNSDTPCNKLSLQVAWSLVQMEGRL